MKNIYWEYNRDVYNPENNVTCCMLAGAAHDDETDNPTGAWFRWKYLAQIDNNVGLHCVYERQYRTKDIAGFSLEKLNELREKSLLNLISCFLFVYGFLINILCRRIM